MVTRSLAIVAPMIATGMLTATLVTFRNRALPLAGWMLIPIVPLLALGQVWTIGLLQSRGSQRSVGPRVAQWRTRVFGGLPWWAVTIAVLGFYGSSAVAMISSWRSHDVSTPQIQRTLLAVLSAFFVMHAAIAGGEVLLWRRAEGDGSVSTRP